MIFFVITFSSFRGAVSSGAWLRTLGGPDGSILGSRFELDAALLLIIRSFLLTMELFLLTVVFGSFFTYSWSCVAYNFSSSTCTCSFFAYNGKLHLISTLTDGKQRSSTVSKEAPTVSKKDFPLSIDTPATKIHGSNPEQASCQGFMEGWDVQTAERQAITKSWRPERGGQISEN